METKVKKKQLCIGGMTCINCQNRIERKLKNTAGVIDVNVSYTSGILNISYDPDLINLKDIENVIVKLGYDVLPDGKKEGADITRVICLLVIIVCAYVLLERFGILNLLVPSQLAETSMGYGMLFIVGLITSVHCIAMCGGINLSQCLPKTENAGEEKGWFSTFAPSFLYNLGRVISYTVIGFILGLMGMILGGGTGTGISSMFQGVLKLVAGTVMVIMGVNMLNLVPALRKLTPRMPKFLAAKIGAKRARSSQPLVVGLINGLMPCGPLQSMQIVALASGNPFAGALSMFLFSLGTVPLMLGLGSIVSALGKKFTHTVMSVGAVLVIVLGLAMLTQGGSLSGLIQPAQLFVLIIIMCVLCVISALPIKKAAIRYVSITAAACVGLVVFCCWNHFSPIATASASNGSVVTDGVQTVSSTLYPGKLPSITVQAGVPVKWVIYAPEGSINGCNYKILISEYGIEYAFNTGENVIEFTPTKEKTVNYTCWMGMLRGTISVTDGEIIGEFTDTDSSESDEYLYYVPECCR